MKKFLKEHILFIENILQKEKKDFDWQALVDFHRVQIGFLQHERLAHLLITLFFGLVFFGSIIAQLILVNIGLMAASVILLGMLSFYIWHYFILENGVQKLYQLDKKIIQHYSMGNILN